MLKGAQAKKIAIFIRKNNMIVDVSEEQMISLAKELSQEMPIEIISTSQVEENGIPFKKISNPFIFLDNRILHKIARRIPGIDILYYLIKFSLYKRTFKRFFGKNKYDLVFINSDVVFSEEIVIAQCISTAVIQITMESCDVGFNLLVDRVERGAAGKKLHLLDKLLKLNEYCRYGSLREPYGRSSAKHIVLKLLNMLPDRERRGGGKSKYLFVLGERYKEIFEDFGVNPEKIYATGSAHYFQLNQYRKKVSIKKTGIEGKIVISIFLQTFEAYPFYGKYSYEECVQILEEKLHAILGDKLLIWYKPHPKNSAKFVKEILSKTKSKYEVFLHNHGISNEEIMMKSDLVITQSSTIGFDAMVLKKPFIAFNFGLFDPPVFELVCSQIYVNTPCKFETLARRLLIDTTFREEIVEKAYIDVQEFIKIKSNPSEAIAKIIKAA